MTRSSRLNLTTKGKSVGCGSAPSHGPVRGVRPCLVANRSGWRGLVVLVLAIATVSVPGCGGCRKSQPKSLEELLQEEEEKQARLREKEKPPFEMQNLVSQPYETKPERPQEPKADRCWYKPGHWTAVTVPAKANHDDFHGELETTVVDKADNLVPLFGMPFTMSGSRAAALPKGQLKVFESVLYVPSGNVESRINSRISDRESGRSVIESGHIPAKMPPYQYHFVVLARFPERYAYWKALDCCRYPFDLKTSTPDSAFYRLLLLPGERVNPLPSYGLLWTSIAYMLWDEVDPATIRPDQQSAMLDWLHWGGQLIISGPDTLDGLRDSFLGPYLPATSPGGGAITAARLKLLSDHWSVGSAQAAPRPLVPVQAWNGVKLGKHPRARFIPDTGDLVVERKIGRGRIVVTAFSLAARELLAWPGFDGFVNACLLGRPSRQFYRNDATLGGIQVYWADRRPLSAQPPVAQAMPNPLTPNWPAGAGMTRHRSMHPPTILCSSTQRGPAICDTSPVMPAGRPKGRHRWRTRMTRGSSSMPKRTGPWAVGSPAGAIPIRSPMPPGKPCEPPRRSKSPPRPSCFG